jgi:GNAT superfamily N-acetyltransferase
VDRAEIDLSSLSFLQLTDEDQPRLDAFASEDADLNDFLRSDALRLQKQNIVRTFLLYDLDEKVCGYVALMSDAIVLESRERKSIQLSHADHPVVPAIKIARLAVTEEQCKLYRGTGTALVRFAFLEALAIAQRVGCRLLTLDAYPNAIGFYEKLGFLRNKAKEYRERTHPSMRLDLLAPDLPPWLAKP